MATLDKGILQRARRRRVAVIAAAFLIWSLLSVYMAYYIDAILWAVIKGEPLKIRFDIVGLAGLCVSSESLRIWCIVCEAGFVLFTLLLMLRPTARIKDIRTIRVTDEIEIPKAVGNGQYGNARFATDKEVTEMTYSFAFSGSESIGGNGGLVLDMRRAGKKEMIRYSDENVHSLILGSTGSGKTRRVLLETIWLQIMGGTSIVVSDVKGEIYYYTKDFAEANGYRSIAFDLRSPEKSMRYNFLQPILNALRRNDRAKAIDYTWDLVSVLVGEQKGEPLWYNGETATIAAAILCVAMEAEPQYRNLTNVYYFLAYMCQQNPAINDTPLTYYLQTLPDSHPAKVVFAMAQVSANRTRASFYTSAMGTLRLFTNPHVAAMTAESDFELDDIGLEKTALYMMIPDEKKTLYPLASLLIQQLYIAQVETANKNGLVLPIRTDYDLDEIGNFPKIPILENMASAGRSRGIRMNLVLQDYQQMEKNYKESFETIKTCCQIKVLLKTDNPKTLKEISEMLGPYTVEVTSASASSNTGTRMEANYSSSSNMAGRSLLMPEELSKLKAPYALVMKTGENPFISRLPDLSEYRVNRIFGLGDEEHNRKLIVSREEARKARTVTEIPLWGIWNKYKEILAKEAERKVSFLK